MHQNDELAERIAALTTEQRAMLEGALAEKADNGIPRRPRDGDPPLSFAQQRLWLLDQLEPGTATYNVAHAIRLEGPLQIEALGQALNALVARHEALRTTFALDDGEPVQVIHSPRGLPLAVHDLRGVPADERAAHAERLRDAEARTPFDLQRGPLLRASVLRLDETSFLLLLTLHHIVSDGWSMSVLYRELGTLYRAELDPATPALPALPVQYADFALWQREWLRGEVLERELRHWRDRLGGELPVLELPGDRPRPAVQSHRGAEVMFGLSPALADGLQALRRDQGVTLFMLLLAAFKTLLHRYSGQSDLLVGTPIANRNRVETEPLIGFFANTLVLRSDLSGDPPFTTLLERVHDTALDAYLHQDLPFEKLVEELNPERSRALAPLFQTMFALQNMPRSPLTLPDVDVEQQRARNHTAKFDLSVYMQEEAGRLTGRIEYNTDIFDAATIERMAGHYRRLLESIVDTPGARLSELTLLSAPERQQLLVHWNDTATDYPREQCIHHLFQAQAMRTPEAPALSFEHDTLSYRDLNTRANRLAHLLLSRGVGPDTLVALCLQRSSEMVVAVLAILKAGGAYLPLDPAYPTARLAFMLDDTRAPVLITEQRLTQHLHGALPAQPPQLLCIDAIGDTLEQQPRHDPGAPTTADNLAYVIYTSGSTGTPKGVAVPHRALLNLLTSMATAPGMRADDVLLAVTSLSFDIAALELLLPLMLGAQVVVVPAAVAADGPALAARLEHAGATVMQATPATWRLLLEAGWQGRRTLRVLCGGETLHASLAAQLLERTASVWNLYGPTETTIYSTAHAVAHASESPTVPIGQPIANTRVYVLDTNMSPVPAGVPGELYIGGDGLARGYLNRPELTAQAFVADPFSNHPDARLYRTGDRVRRLRDGCVEFLGRLDHQVKLRGFRIELGEIECVLASHPAVQSAVAVVREDSTHEKRLLAYVVANAGHDPQPAQLRDFLQELLPNYMLPAAVLRLDALPLTPNGKIDRHALPAPVHQGFGDGADIVAPRTPVEETLATIWRELLGVDRVSIHDNFFDLGGHSLLATRLVAKANAALCANLSLREVFLGPTIDQLGLTIAQSQVHNSTAEAMLALLDTIDQQAGSGEQRDG